MYYLCMSNAVTWAKLAWCPEVQPGCDIKITFIHSFIHSFIHMDQCSWYTGEGPGQLAWLQVYNMSISKFGHHWWCKIHAHLATIVYCLFLFWPVWGWRVQGDQKRRCPVGDRTVSADQMIQVAYTHVFLVHEWVSWPTGLALGSQYEHFQGRWSWPPGMM